MEKITQQKQQYDVLEKVFILPRRKNKKSENDFIDRRGERY
jgi:hypothetical protein